MGFSYPNVTKSYFQFIKSVFFVFLYSTENYLFMIINLHLKRTFILGAAILTLSSANAQEQNVTQSQGVADVKKEVNFMQLALKEAYNKPEPKPIEFVGNRKAREIPEMDPADLTNVKMDPFGKYTDQNR